MPMPGRPGCHSAGERRSHRGLPGPGAAPRGVVPGRGRRRRRGGGPGAV